MIDKVRFIKAMEYITLAYPNSKIEVDNTSMMNVWYDVLKDFDDESFTMLLKDFVKNNQFPPQSPAHIIAYYKETQTKNINSADMFERLIQRIRDSSYDLDLVISRYEKGGQDVIVKTIKELRSNFILWFNDSNQISFLKNAFIKAYEQNYKNKLDDNVSKGLINGALMIENNHDS